MVARARTLWSDLPLAAWGIAGLVASVLVLAGWLSLAYAAGDTEPPSIPGNVTASPGAASPTIATIAWDASTDNVEVAGYRVWRSVRAASGYRAICTTEGLAFSDVTGVPGQEYYYRVSAFDSTQNESGRSSAAGPVTASWSQPPHAAYGSGDLCAWCHTPHGAATAEKIFRDTGVAGGELPVCYACHDGQGASTNVETGPENSFALASGHALEQVGESGDLTDACSGCHTPHRDYTSRRMLPGTHVNGIDVATADNGWCFACHDDANSWFGAGYPDMSTPTTNAAGYPIVGTYPGETVYSGAGNGHRIIPAAPGIDREAGDCLYCHSSHRGANAYDGLTSEFRPSDLSTLADDQANGTYAGACLYCHGPVRPSEFTTSPVDIRQYVVSGTARAGHRIKTAGGTLPVGAPLPCYDCHNPHGSSRGNALLLSDVLGEGLDIGDAAGVRSVCLSCHATSDGMVWDSVASTYVAVGSQRVEGLRRDGSDGSVLRLPAATGHLETDARPCFQCHGGPTSDAGPHNVHDPSGGVSEGGEACYGCHVAYRDAMEDGVGDEIGASRADTYHHVMGSAAEDGDTAFAAGSYPSSATDVYCMSCHVDHDKFNSAKAGNLRPDIATLDPTGAATDYDSASDSGVCTSCHAASLSKQNPGTDRQDDGSSATPRVVEGAASGQFGASAHDYVATSGYDASTFSANCSKCHNDEQTKDFQTSTNRFGTHWSAVRRLLSALGGSVADPLAEQHCYRCHSETSDAIGGTVKPAAGRDWYDAVAMTTVAGTERVYKQFQLASKHPVVGVGGNTVECESCHNAHVVTTTARATDPANTYDTIAYTGVDDQPAFCLRCHDGAPPSYEVNGTTYVPYDVTIAAADAAVMDKSPYTARGHWSAAGAISAGERQSCAVCHDNHGSAYTKLLGAYDPATGANQVAGQAITGNDNSVCLACHTSASTGFPTYARLANGYPGTATYPGNAVYIGANGIHKTAALPAPFTYAAGDCKNCHDVHGTSNTYDATRGRFDPGSAGNDKYALCFGCHDSDGPSTRDIRQFYPTTAGGTQTQGADTRYGHKTETPSGTLGAGAALPCYDCHNPHGSASADGLMVVTNTAPGTPLVLGTATYPFDLSSAAGVRRFCFACHTTAGATDGLPDTTPYGWDGAAYASVTAGAPFEGVDRTVHDTVNKRGLKLPPVSGHFRDDTQTCFSCHGGPTASSTNNVHNPGSGVSNGGLDCYTCHVAYQSYMEDGTGKTGTSRALAYHHVLGDGAYDGDKAFLSGAYPGAGVNVYCLSCHVDHDKFNSDIGANLRDSMAADPAASNSDFSGVSPYGVCVGCHSASLAKDTANQVSSSNNPAADPSASTPAISGSDYAASSHDYNVTSSFDSSAFDANCAKCHNDEQAKTYQTSANKFGTHWSATRRLLAALGATGPAYSDPYGDSFCYKCHKGDDTRYPGNPNANDYYNATAMTLPARTVADPMMTQKLYLATGGASNGFRSYNISANTWAAETNVPFNVTTGGFGVATGGWFSVLQGGTTGWRMLDVVSGYNSDTIRWLNTSGGQPALPILAGAGASAAFDGEYLYYAAGGGNSLKTYRLNTLSSGANRNEFYNAWVDAETADLTGTGFAAGGNMEWGGGDFIYAQLGNNRIVTRYQVSTNTWSDAGAADTPVMSVVANNGADLCMTSSNTIYAILGNASPTLLKGTIDSSGVITGWMAMANAPGNFNTGASLAWDYGRYVYATAGNSTQILCRYDTLADSWTTLQVTGQNVGAGSRLMAFGRRGHLQIEPRRHRSDEEAVASEGWANRDNRHVVCEDCHSPHQAAAGTHTQGTDDIGNANKGVWGVAYTPPTYTLGTATFTSGNNVVNGQGTNWVNANGIYPGAWIQDNADRHYYQIATLNSPTQLTLASNYLGTTAPTSAYTMRLGYAVGTVAWNKGSRTVTGTGTNWTTTSVPVGSYIRSNDFGGWYRVNSVDSATQITVNDPYRGRTITTRAYNVIRVSFTKVASTANTKQSQICFKCHTSYAWGSGAPPRAQSSAPSSQFWRQTDVAVDFDPVNYAYHPLFQRGRNQPPSNANGNWAGAGRKNNTWSGGANPATGLDNTFTDGWGTQSLVTCSDCHDHPTPSSGPKGPHGSAYKWLLKGADPNVTVTLASAPGSPRYPNRLDYTSSGTPVYPTAFCLNCHRGDVYRWGSTMPGSNYGNLSRMDHYNVPGNNCVPTLPLDNNSGGTYWPNSCMNCHGGDTAGGIHGTSRGTGYTSGTPGGTVGQEMGKRFMNGSSWTGHVLGDQAANTIGCYTIATTNDVSGCTGHANGRQNNNSIYTYPWE